MDTDPDRSDTGASLRGKLSIPSTFTEAGKEVPFVVGGSRPGELQRVPSLQDFIRVATFCLAGEMHPTETCPMAFSACFSAGSAVAFGTIDDGPLGQRSKNSIQSSFFSPSAIIDALPGEESQL